MADSGWIDLQVNGREGIDFTGDDLTVAKTRRLVEVMRAGGTTGFLATICTTSEPNAEHSLRVIAEARRQDALCRETILGVHMEGPFLSSLDGYIGTHAPDIVRDPEISTYERWQDVSGGIVRMVTLAGERSGAEDFVRHVTARGTVVSLGHTAMWQTDDLGRMVRVGAKALTHLGNGIPNELPRHDNLIWTGLANPDLVKMFIADGFHLPREVLHGFVRAASLDKLVVVSDCVFAGGLPPGTYTRGGGAAMTFSIEGPGGYKKGWTFPKTFNYLSGNVDWIPLSGEFTVPADAPEGLTGCVMPFVRYAVGETWFDGVALEEVME